MKQKLCKSDSAVAYKAVKQKLWKTNDMEKCKSVETLLCMRVQRKKIGCALADSILCKQKPGPASLKFSANVYEAGHVSITDLNHFLNISFQRSVRL